ncbi:MAG: glucose-1-phosphate thymidylyltransferase, partial [Candidatus Neomarinimicrobiota bacterium]|nr:glucose-1-phosphate thymidylyltransferase [Candidatus Neomarinimicrobiota bacterium]
KEKNDGYVDSLTTMSGEVIIGKNSQIINSKINGPAIIDNDTVIKDSFIGPYSSIANNCKITSSKVEYSIMMEGCEIDCVDRNIKSSLLGKNVKIISSNDKNNQARFLLGDQSHIELID